MPEYCGMASKIAEMPPAKMPCTAEYASTRPADGFFLKMLTSASTKPTIAAGMVRKGTNQPTAAPRATSANAPTAFWIVSS